MIKVLNIISDTNIGGAGRALLSYLAHADRENFDNSVILPQNSSLAPRLSELGIRYIEADIIPDKSFSPGDTGKLKRLIRAEDPDVVHTHGSLTGRMAAKACGVPAVITRHSAFPYPAYIRKTPLKLGYKFLYEHYAQRIVAISPAGAQTLYDVGVAPDRVDVMMNGAEPAERLSDAERERLRSSLGVTGEDFLLGALARIEEYKGHRDMADALSRLIAEGRRVKLLIVGTGGFEAELKEYIAAQGLNDSVIFTGFRSDVGAMLSIMDLQLNASYVSETSSLSIIEGMSIGLPAVVSNFCGNPYLITNGVSGLLFEPRDSADLAEKIGKIMDDPELYKNLSAGAKREYSEKFTGERFAADLEAVYKRALEMGKNGK